MDQKQLLIRMAGNMAAFWGAVATSSQGGMAIELEALTASLVPTLPHSPYLSLFNTIVIKQPRLHPAALHEVESAFLDAGVRVWSAWVHESNTDIADLLEEEGYAQIATSRAMGRELVGDQTPPRYRPVASASDRIAAAEVNEAVWHISDKAFMHMLAEFTHPDMRLYVAEIAGKKAACVTAFTTPRRLWSLLWPPIRPRAAGASPWISCAQPSLLLLTKAASPVRSKHLRKASRSMRDSATTISVASISGNGDLATSAR